MASIKVTVVGWEAELDIPNDDDVMDYLRRECMVRACDKIQRRFAFQAVEYDTDKAAVLRALMAAIEAQFPHLPAVELTEE